MKKMDFCEVMGDISEDYIQAAQLCRKQSFAENTKIKVKTKGKLPLVLLAACVCLMIFTATALAVSGFGTHIIEFFTDHSKGPDHSESGYDLNVLIEKIPISELKGDVSEVGELIAKQYKEHNLFSSWLPGHWQKSFASRAEASEYIGLDRLKMLDFDVTEKETNINVYGNVNGAIKFLNIETIYTDGDIRLQFFSRIYTENYAGEITERVRTTETVQFSEFFYTTQSSRQCHIIKGSALESGYMSMDGYITDSGVLYKLHVAYLEKDAERAEELLRQWADLF